VIFLVVFLVVAALLATNYLFWKLGVIKSAEKPESVIDRPIMDAKERKAFLKRLKRWKEEGKVSRAEFENLTQLCEEEWDQGVIARTIAKHGTKQSHE
jgi:hypothetical protein